MLALVSAMLMMTMPARADWWPSERYCSFIRDIYLDKTWKFDTSINDGDAASGTPSTLSPTQDAPGYMCFNIMSWDNKTKTGDDHDLDWCQLELYNRATNEYFPICYLDFLPESSPDKEWENEFKYEGNFNITTDPAFYKNMNGCETRYCKKRMYRYWQDGCQFCFFNIKYSESARKFIEKAGSSLQIYLKGRYDDSDYESFNKYTDWAPGDFIANPNAPKDLKITGYTEDNGQTFLKLSVPGVDDGIQMRAWLQTTNSYGANSLYIDEHMEGSSMHDVMWNLCDLSDSLDAARLNSGEYYVTAHNIHHYPQSSDGYHGHAMRIYHSDLPLDSDPYTVQLPQLRMGRNLVLTNRNDGTIQVKWSADAVNTSRPFANEGWVVERSSEPDFISDSTVCSPLINYDKSKTSYEYIDEVPDRNLGEKKYYYRVRRNYEFTKSKHLCISGTITIQTNYTTITALSASPVANNVVLTWALDKGIWTSDMQLELLRDDSPVSFGDSTYMSTHSYEFKAIPVCQPTNIELRIKENSQVLSNGRIEGLVLPDSIPSVMKSLSLSKGFYNDRVKLDWSVDSEGANFNHFVIKRKKYGEPDSQYRVVKNDIMMSVNKLEYSYTDSEVAAGTLYSYLLEGWTTCNDSIGLGDTKTGIGFAQPYGIVSGQVLFENGQAVENVVIDVTTDEAGEHTSLEFGTKGYGTISRTTNSIFNTGKGAAEMFVRLGEHDGIDTIRMLLAQKDGIRWYISHEQTMTLELTRNNNVYRTTCALQDSTVNWLDEAFNALGFSDGQRKDTLERNRYSNGKQAAGELISGVTGSNLGIGVSNHPMLIGAQQGDSDCEHFLSGYLSEIRLWNTNLTEQQIQNRVDGILSGREAGLTAYYRGDRIVDGETYDVSGDGANFNQRHMTLSDVQLNTYIAPTQSQLAVRARTNNKGSYLINTVPYTQQGTLYDIVASYGTHQFKPAVKTLFFDATAPTHNSIDFTDISTFLVSGTITYAGGTYPAEGIMFKVDGITQNDGKGEMIKSDEEGHFAFRVPVGIHNVQAFCGGHTLTNDGWISEVDGSPINYQRDYSGITIADSTRVRFIGRVCGGEIQKALPVGHTLSRNNLGDGLRLLLMQNHSGKYKLASQLWSDTLTHQTPSIYALDVLNPKRKAVPVKNAVDYSEDFVTIHVNDSTGEFYADVFPINYTIQLTVPFYPQPEEHGQQISFVGMSEETNITPETYNYTDCTVGRIATTANGKDSLVFSEPKQYIDTVYYSKKQVFCIRRVPELTFTQIDQSGSNLPYYGMDSAEVKVDTMFHMVAMYDANRLYRASEENQDSVHYTMGAPYYEAGLTYNMRVQVAEIYRKYGANGDTAVSYVDMVPTMDAVVEIHNTMATEEQTRFSLDSTGVGYYSFVPTEPNFSSGQGKISAVTSYNQNKNTLSWEPPFGNNGFCFYTGSHKKGSDFITAGPNHLITILRDPPGSGSYAYLEEGTTFKQNNYWAWKDMTSGKFGGKFSFGTNFTRQVGIGISFEMESMGISNNRLAYEHDYSWTRYKKQEITITTNQRYSTSSAENYVGADADVFVGYANNYTLAVAEMVQMVDSATYNHADPERYPKCYGSTADGRYKLVQTTGISVGSQFATEFIYTQRDIIQQEIPRLESLLHNILVPYNQADSIRMQALTNEDRQVRYMNCPGITSESSNYACEGAYYRIIPDENHRLEGDTIILSSDTILTIKDWIDDWKSYLGLNEYQKWKAIQTNNALVRNYSLAGGSSLTMTDDYKTSLTYGYANVKTNKFFLDMGTNTSMSDGIFWAITLEVEEHAGASEEDDDSNTITTSHTKGFVLAPNSFERLSVDVLHEADWSEGEEIKNMPEWNEGNIADKGTKDTEKVYGEVSQLDCFPSFIFYTRGGQTCCPYEPEVKSKYIDYYLARTLKQKREAGANKTEILNLMNDSVRIYGKQALLNQSTLAIDHPRLEVVNDYVDGVPTGEAAYVTIRMSNESESDTERPFWLGLKEDSNPHGAGLSIDGTSLGTALTGGTGVSYLIPAGSTLEKTVRITKGSTLDYDNLTLYIYPYCELYPTRNAIKDSYTFSVHFTPSCSGISIKTPGNNWVYNTDLDMAINPTTGKMERYLPVELSDFDVNYDEFDHIELQYKPSSDTEARWRKVQYFYRDSVSLRAAIADGKDPQLVSICQGGVIRYQLYMDDQDDQEYDMRAVTYCRNGNEMVENYSDVVSGIKDTYCPRLFGAAKPANGILTIEDEIRLDFNEDIAGGKLTYNNFSVTGILDDAVSDHQVAVHLSGDGRLQTELPVYLDEAYTLEGWFRQTNETGEQVLFALGEAPYTARLALNKQADQLVLYVDTFMLTYPLGGRWQPGEWNHVTIRRETGHYTTSSKMFVALNFSDLTASGSIGAYLRTIKGKLTIGNGFIGDIDQVRLWDIKRDNADLRASAATHISNTSVGLIACYNMDENRGTVLEDVSGGHTMLMDHATWTVPAGHALHLDGATYATLPMAEHSLSGDNDYTLDFWFRAPSASEESMLLSTGLTDSVLGNNGLQIMLNERGRIVVTSGLNPRSYAASSSSKSYRDNRWHHVLYSVGRSTGFARLYVDGAVVATVTQDNIGGLAGSRMFVGVQPNYDTESQNYTYSQYFTGEIDEIRLQNMYLSQFQVESFLMQKTDSAMLGLMYYYPFERYETSAIGISSMVYSLRNFCQGHSDEQATVMGNTSVAASDEAAPVATGSSLTRLDHTGFTFTPSDNAIILTLTKPLARIEHSILTFTAEDVRDIHGNKMLSPVTWAAYIDRNPLVVDQTDIKLTTPVNTPIDYTLSIQNRSGAFHDFVISGVPTWMDLERESGTVGPNETMSVSFSTKPSMAIGTHTAHLYLTNSDDVVIPITVAVTVEGSAPKFDFDPASYPYSMNIVGQICIDGITSLDERDMLAAFSDGECVGIGYTTYYKNQDAYYVNLTVYSDTTSQRPLTYLIYDASTGCTYDADCLSAVRWFTNNAIIGSPASPAVFFNTKNEYRTYDLQTGWNWLSWNVEVSGGNTPANVLGTNWPSGTLVKTYDASEFFDYRQQTQTWSSANTMDSTRMWVLYTEQPRTLLISGTPIKSQTPLIPIRNGWNGISYLPSVNLTPREAFAGMTFGDICNDDVVKSQTEFAIYFNGDWVGTLKTMHPGEGYMFYHKGEDFTFRYPTININTGRAPMRASVRHETTMSVVARPEGIMAEDGDVLKVYAGDELVGAAQMQDGLWFVSIAGEHSRVPLRFVCQTMLGSSVSMTETCYQADAILGSPAAPYRLLFDELTQDGLESQSKLTNGAEKQIHNDQLIIIYNGRTYNAQGALISTH